jgi:hypothetical protein
LECLLVRWDSNPLGHRTDLICAIKRLDGCGEEELKPPPEEAHRAAVVSEAMIIIAFRRVPAKLSLVSIQAFRAR